MKCKVLISRLDNMDMHKSYLDIADNAKLRLDKVDNF